MRPQPYTGDKMNPVCTDFRTLSEVPLKVLDIFERQRVLEALGDETFAEHWQPDGQPRADADAIRQLARRKREELLDDLGAEGRIEVRGGMPKVEGPGRRVMA
jgi:hypothetical protein